MSNARAGQLDVCVVSWRTRGLLKGCLRSLVGRPEVASVTVVDNASDDGTAEMVAACFHDVRLILNQENMGFAAGNNQAMRAGSAPFVLLLNPDTEVQQSALAALLAAFEEDPRIGAVAAQLVLPSGAVQRSCRGFPEPGALLAEACGLARLLPGNQGLGRYRMRYWGHSHRRDVDQPMASALALRRRALDEVGLFDEAFPLYFNDVDLCYRLWHAGWRIVYEPAARVLHRFGESSTWRMRPSAILESHRGLIRFYAKHYRGRVPALGYWTVVALAWLTMWPRAALAALCGRRPSGVG